MMARQARIVSKLVIGKNFSSLKYDKLYKYTEILAMLTEENLLSAEDLKEERKKFSARLVFRDGLNGKTARGRARYTKY